MFMGDVIQREEWSDGDLAHFKIRKRDSQPWREESTSQQGTRQHKKGSGRHNQQLVFNATEMQDAVKDRLKEDSRCA